MLSFMAFLEDAADRDKGLGNILLQAAPAVGSYVVLMENDGVRVTYLVSAIVLSASRVGGQPARCAGDLVLQRYPGGEVLRDLLFGPREASVDEA